MILAPFATATFLAALWLVAKLALDWLAKDGFKIAAALDGQSWASRVEPEFRPVSVRYRPRAGSARLARRVVAEWRAAA